MKQAPMLITAELRPTTNLSPEPPYTVWIHPDGTVTYDEENTTEAYAVALVNMWLGLTARGKLKAN